MTEPSSPQETFGRYAFLATVLHLLALAIIVMLVHRKRPEMAELWAASDRIEELDQLQQANWLTPALMNPAPALLARLESRPDPESDIVLPAAKAQRPPPVEPEASPKPNLTPTPKPETPAPKPAAKPETPAPKLKPAPAPKKPDLAPAKKPEPKLTRATPKPAAKVEPQPEPKPGPKLTPAPKPQPVKPKPVSKPKPKPVTKPAVVSKPAPAKPQSNNNVSSKPVPAPKARPVARARKPSAGSIAATGDLSSYHRHLKSAYFDCWDQPRGLIVSGKKYRVRTEIAINRDGRILSAKIVTPSGNQEMDDSVRNAVSKVSRINPLPSAIAGSTYRVILNFDL